MPGFAESLGSALRQIPTLPVELDRLETAAANHDSTTVRSIAPVLCDCFYFCSGQVYQTVGYERLVRCFRLLRRWTRIEAYEFLEEIPDELQVFRGGSGSVELLRGGLSWSARREYAESFAVGAGARLLEATVSKDAILAVLDPYIDLVVDPDLLRNLRELPLKAD